VKNARPQRRQDQRKNKERRNLHVDVAYSVRVKLSLGLDVTEAACLSTVRFVRKKKKKKEEGGKMVNAQSKKGERRSTSE